MSENTPSSPSLALVSVSDKTGVEGFGRELERLGFRVLSTGGTARSLRDAGVSVLYVSHFLDELFEICDRVTTMRDGKTVDCRSMEGVTKLDLIARMLGRDASEIAEAGMTEFGGGSAKQGEVLLQAASIATGPRLTKFDMTVHRGEIVGLGGLLGAGRTEAARALFGVDQLTNGTIWITF